MDQHLPFEKGDIIKVDEQQVSIYIYIYIILYNFIIYIYNI